MLSEDSEMLIYKPKGRAREYAKLALNLYSQCGHGCTYCWDKDKEGYGAVKLGKAGKRVRVDIKSSFMNVIFTGPSCGVKGEDTNGNSRKLGFSLLTQKNYLFDKLKQGWQKNARQPKKAVK